MTTKKKYVGNVRDLIVYRKALLFRKTIYAIVKQLPEHEQFNLGDMFRKCSCSIVSNLAEGNTNFYYNKEYNHLNMALSKIGECRSALDIAQMAGYIDKTVYKNADSKGEELLKMIVGMMKRIQRHLSNEQDKSEEHETVNKSKFTPISLLEIYNKATIFNDFISGVVRQYPTTEVNNMKDQIVRASQSILKNLEHSQINSHPQSFLDSNTVLGSISECLAFLDMGVMEGFISRKQYEVLNDIGGDMLDSIVDLMGQSEQSDGEEAKEVS